MSDISKITTPDGIIYNIKDAFARTALNGHTVGANVPSGAKFTDTTYTAGDNITLIGTEFSLTSQNVIDALGYIPGNAPSASINGVDIKGALTFEKLGEETITNNELKNIIDTQFAVIFGGN